MDPSLRNKTAIVGVGYTAMERKSGRSLPDVAMEAAKNAIADAGLTPADIDGYAGTPKAPNASALHWDGVDEISERYMASALGLNLRWASDFNRGVVGDAVAAAIQSLVTGTANYVVCLRAMYERPGVRYAASESSASGGPEQFTAPYGVGIGAMAMWLQRYMHDYGATREELFDVVSALRGHAQLNPYAYWRGKPLTLDDYLSSRWVYEPMCLYDYDIPVTGAGAVVLTTADRAKDLPHRPAYVSGFVSTRERGDAIFEASDIGREAVQAAQLYDGFSPVVWKWLEELGFADRGEAHEFTRDGRIAHGGALPVTTFGGSQGEGRLHGMGHVREGAMQVMGRADERQVPGLENCLVALGFDAVPSWVFMLSTG